MSGIPSLIAQSPQTIFLLPEIEATKNKTVTEIESIAQFKEELGSSQPLVVNFYAPELEPCQSIHSLIESSAEQLEGKYKFLQINANELQELVKTYNIQSYPTLLLFDKGLLEEKKAGEQAINELLARLQNSAIVPEDSRNSWWTKGRIINAIACAILAIGIAYASHALPSASPHYSFSDLQGKPIDVKYDCPNRWEPACKNRDCSNLIGRATVVHAGGEECSLNAQGYWKVKDSFSQCLGTLGDITLMYSDGTPVTKEIIVGLPFDVKCEVESPYFTGRAFDGSSRPWDVTQTSGPFHSLKDIHMKERPLVDKLLNRV